MVQWNHNLMISGGLRPIINRLISILKLKILQQHPHHILLGCTLLIHPETSSVFFLLRKTWVAKYWQGLELGSIFAVGLLSNYRIFEILISNYRVDELCDFMLSRVLIESNYYCVNCYCFPVAGLQVLILNSFVIL